MNILINSVEEYKMLIQDENNTNNYFTQDFLDANNLTLSNIVMVNCTDCLNCINCWYCINCINCVNCDECVDCTDCVTCYGCNDCVQCTGLDFCLGATANTKKSLVKKIIDFLC
jgi:hypothetical protein